MTNDERHEGIRKASAQRLWHLAASTFALLCGMAAVARCAAAEKDWWAVDDRGCVAATTVPGEANSLLPEGRRFKLVWHDEFNGTELDTSKWMFRTNFWGGACRGMPRPRTVPSK